MLLTPAAIAALSILFSYGANAAGYAWFQRPTDTVRASSQTVLNTTCTFEAVVMLPSTGYAAGRIFNEWTNSQEDKQLKIGPSTVAGNAFPPSGALDGTATIVLDVWHHVAFVADGSEQRIYLDGVLIISRLAGSSIGNGTGAGFIGAIFRDGTVDPAFVGYLDSLRISRVARYSGAFFTPILGDFASDADTLLLYNFNEAPGSTTVKDESPLGRTGTLGVGFGTATSPRFVTNSSGIMLSVRLAGQKVLLSWPLVATNHYLQCATNLVSPIQWMSVTNQPVAVGNQLVVTNDSSLDTAFFRLEKR